MIEIKDLPQENAFGFVLDGKISEMETDKLFSALTKKAGDFGKVRLYGEFKNFGGWESFSAFLSNMKANFKAIGKVEKYAVITDNDWLEDLEGVTDFLTPNMDIKIFGMEEKEEAIAWLEQPLKEELLGSEALDLGLNNVLGFVIRDRLTRADYKMFNHKMADQLKRYGKIDMYLEIEDFEGISLKAIWQDLKTSIKYYGDIEKIAITGKGKWLKNATKISDFLTPGIDLKYFSLAEKHKALEWLK